MIYGEADKGTNLVYVLGDIRKGLTISRLELVIKLNKD